MPRACSDGEAGQSLVETALALPILATMLIGAAEGARLLLAAIALTSGVMAGAQYGALSPSNAGDVAGIESAVRLETTPVGGTASNPVVTTSTGTDGAGETYLSVAGTYTWRSLFSYPGLPSSVAITRSAVQQVRR